MKYEIPYEDLMLIGIGKEAFNNLPKEVREGIENGELSPIINVRREMADGSVLEMPVKMRMERDEFGKAGLMVYPMNAEFKNSFSLGTVAFNELSKGDVLHINGKYYQKEPETNCCIIKSDKQVDLDPKLQEWEKVKDVELGVEQKKQIKEGKPVELEVGGEKVTVGLDLRDTMHFKSLKGGLEDWKKQKEIDYDLAHPEYVGIIQTDENRWEKMTVEKKGYTSRELRERPAMTQTSGMKV